MTKHLVRLQIAATTRLNGDRGQGALEYIGILIIVGLVVGFALTAFRGQEGAIGTAIKTAIEKFFKTA